MHKIFYLLIVISLSVGCDQNKSQPTDNSPSPTPLINIASPTPQSSNPPSNLLAEALKRDPSGNVLKQAQIIRDRLRYFGEELKTTTKPEKQKALMENVRETLVPACKEIEVIIPTTILNENVSIRNFLDLCYKLDKALSSHNPKALPPILKDFNSTFESLEKSLATKESN